MTVVHSLKRLLFDQGTGIKPIPSYVSLNSSSVVISLRFCTLSRKPSPMRSRRDASPVPVRSIPENDRSPILIGCRGGIAGERVWEPRNGWDLDPSPVTGSLRVTRKITAADERRLQLAAVATRYKEVMQQQLEAAWRAHFFPSLYFVLFRSHARTTCARHLRKTVG